jgi:hypothetical protein
MEHGETARRARRARQEKNSQQAADSRQLAAISPKDWAPKCKEVEGQKSWGRYFDVPVFQYWVISFCLLAPISLNLYDFNELNGLNGLSNGQLTTNY